MENQGFGESLKNETRLAAIEQRLAKLEKFLGAGEKAAVQPPPAPAPAPAPAPSAPAPAPARQQVLRAPEIARPGSWLGAVAVICFVLAAGFIIKLSIESGWLTPERQIGLAVLLGLGLIGAGLRLQSADAEYAGFLPAAGIVVLYAAVFAAHRFYALIPFETAVAMTAVVSGLCIWIYTQMRQDLYPVTAALGAYFAPAVLGLHAASEFSVYYYLLCSFAFAAISIGVSSRILTLVAAYMSILMTAATGLSLNNDLLIVWMLALNFLVLSAGVYLFTRYNGAPLTERESAGFLPVAFFFYAAEYYFINRLSPGLAPWLSLGFAAVLLVLYHAARRRFPEGELGSGSMVYAFVSVVCFHSFYLELLPPEAQPWMFVVIILAVCASEVPLSVDGRPGRWRVPALALGAVLVIEYISMASHLLSGSGYPWPAVSMFSVAALWILIFFRGREMPGQGGYGALLASAHLLAVLGLYRLTKDNSSLQVTASWLAYAVAVIAFAFSRRDEDMARSAVFVLSFAAGKALLYDAASAPTVVRIVCLLSTGAVLYGAGFFLRRISGWKAERAA